MWSKNGTGFASVGQEFTRFEHNPNPMFNYQAQIQADTATMDQRVSLLPNSPNPFIEMTLLWFRLPEAADVTLRVLDSHGHVVSTKSGRFAKGENHLVLKRADIREPGIYLCRIETPFGSAGRRLVMY